MLKQWIIQLLVSWAINAAALIFTSTLITSIKIHGVAPAFIATFVLAALNATLLRVLWFLTLPFTIITLGLSLLILNGAMLKLTAHLVHGFRVEGWWAAIIGSIVLSIIQAVLFFVYRRIFE